MAGSLDKPESKASSSGAAPPWVELPLDITANILQRLGAEEILESVQKVCMTWRNVCKQASMWRKIHLDEGSHPRLNYEITCQHLVDRSQGQLMDISLAGFGSDSLLNYIVQRSSGGLRCLSLEFCGGVSQDCLVEAAKDLPLLEELRLSCISIVDAEVIELIGRSCPILKSFTFGLPIESSRLFSYDTYAHAIAKSMPQLRHLCLIGNWVLNKDLVVVLDGCTHLESLHLDGCRYFRVDDYLAKRLSQQIKHLKLSESTPYDYGLRSMFVPNLFGFI